jgi:putative aldouronate transport system permease protein
MHRSLSREDKLWDIGVWGALTLVTLMMLVPLWYVLVTSLTSPEVWIRTGGSLWIWPGNISLSAYQLLLSGGQLPHAFGISVYITLLGTALNMIATTLLAYPLSKVGFRPRVPLMALVVFTLLFNGGLIPTYLIVRDLHLVNTYWALMLPNLTSAFNLLVMRAFFQSLPVEIEESARIDGASEWQILWRIVLPLSKPILATIGLFYAVAHWNGFFDAILYLSDANMQPLQVVLRSILNAANLSQFGDISAATALPTETLQMAAVVLTTLPVLLVYPFLQRYFVAGTLLGAVKE